MTNSKEEIRKLNNKADLIFDKTSQLQQTIAQLEATLLREEYQKVTEKTKDT